jgi:hypothetical protein
VSGQHHAPAALPPGKEPPVSIGYDVGWTGRGGKNSWPYRDSNSDHSVIQPVASRYTDWATLAHNLHEYHPQKTTDRNRSDFSIWTTLHSRNRVPIIPEHSVCVPLHNFTVHILEWSCFIPAYTLAILCKFRQLFVIMFYWPNATTIYGYKKRSLACKKTCLFKIPVEKHIRIRR